MKILRYLIPLILAATSAFGQLIPITQPLGNNYTDNTVPRRNGTANAMEGTLVAVTDSNGVNTFGASTASISIAANTATSGLLLSNPTAATSGNQRYSPFLQFAGQQWNGSISRPVLFRQGAVTAVSDNTYVIQFSIDNGSNWSDVFTIHGQTKAVDVDSLTAATEIDTVNVFASALTSGRVTFAGSGGQLSDASTLTFNSGTGALTATTFTSTVATGTAPLTVASTTLVANLHAATADSSTTTTTATNATNVGITNDTATNATMFPLWATANTGNLPAKVTSTKLTFNPSTGVLSSTSFTGAGTGLTGTAASLTAGTVTTNANLTGAVTSSGNATSLGSFTSANLSGALSDETGTGVAVFGTSPALTTSLTTGSTTFALLNTTATTVNFAGGASTALNIGNASGLTSMLGVLGVDGATPSSSTAAIFPAGTTSLSSFRIPHGAAPTSPVNGDFWTTTAGLFGRINNATVAYGAGSGTVTSVGFTGGLISVATATTTPAFTVAGTSGGIPYFSSASTWASSGALTANVLIKGGGAGASPAVSLITDDGTTATYTGTGGVTAPVFTGSGTTPAAMSLIAGTGSIPALTANSAGWAAPATGGTAYLWKPPATATAGIFTAAAPATNDGVNESAVTLTATTGSGNVVLATSPTLTTAVLGSSTATTQSASDNSTKVATTAYADRAARVQTASVNLGNLTGTINIDWSAGTTFRGVLTGNTTFTFSNGTDGQTIIVDVAQTGTNTFTVTWPTMKWPGGVAPTMTTGAATDDITTIVDFNAVFKGNSVQNVK